MQGLTGSPSCMVLPQPCRPQRDGLYILNPSQNNSSLQLFLPIICHNSEKVMDTGDLLLGVPLPLNSGSESTPQFP